MSQLCKGHSLYCAFVDRSWKWATVLIQNANGMHPRRYSIVSGVVVVLTPRIASGQYNVQSAKVILRNIV